MVEEAFIINFRVRTSRPNVLQREYISHLYMLQKFLLQFFLSYAVFVHLFVRSGSPTVKDLPNSVFWSGISVWNNPVGLIITWGLFMRLQGPDYPVVKIMIILRIVVSICWTFWATEAKRFF